MTLPDFFPEELTPERVTESFNTYGCLLVRQLIPVTWRQGLEELAESAFAVAANKYAKGQMPPHIYQYYYRHGHVIPEGEAEAPYAQSLLNLIGSPLMGQIIRPILGEQSLLLPYAVITRQGPALPHAPLPFHQDADFIGTDPLMFTCWVPLTPCGEDAPGLEIVPIPQPFWLHQPLMSRYIEGENSNYAISGINSLGLSERFGARDFWRPVMEPGDALFFTHLIIHRTWSLPTMVHTRQNISFRLAHASYPQVHPNPANYWPIATGSW